MPKAKIHLKNIFRTEPNNFSRVDYLRLDMNENVSALPSRFVKNVFSKITNEFIATYPEYKVTQEKIAVHNNLKPENIYLANGSDAAIKYIFETYISKGNKVLITNPTFAMYYVYCDIYAATPISISYHKDFSFPKQEFIDKISTSIKMAIIVNPNNPTGTAVEMDYLSAVIKEAQKKDVLMIIDEAYFYFYPQTIIEQVKKFDNLIVLRSFSKLCGLAGARIGYAAGCSEIIGNLKKVSPSYDINGIANVFVNSLLDNKTVIPHLVKKVYEGKEYLIRRLSNKNIGYNRGYANFILIKCGGSANTIRDALKEKGILVAAGFRQDFLKEYIRVTIGDIRSMNKFWNYFIEIWDKLRICQ